MFKNETEKLKRISLSIFGGFFIECCNKLIPILILAYAQSRIGLTGFGKAQFIITLVELFIPFVVFGYSYYAALSYVEHEKNKQNLSDLVSSVFILRLFHALFASLVLSLYIFYIQNDHFDARNLIYVLPILFFAALDMTYINYGSQRMLRLSVVTGICKLLSLAFILSFIKVPSDLWKYTCATLGVGSAVNLYTTFWVLPKVGFRCPSWSRLTYIFKSSLPFAGIVLLIPLFERFDVFVVEKMTSSLELGLYMGSWRLAISFLPFLHVIISIFLSEGLVHQSNYDFAKQIDWAFFISLSLIIPIFVGSLFVGDELLVLMYSEKYLAAHDIFSIFFLSLIAESFVLIFGLQVMLLRAQVQRFVLGMLFFISFGLLVCYFLSLTGAFWLVATGAALTRLLCGIWCFIESRRILGIQADFGKVIKVLLASAFMAVTLSVSSSMGFTLKIILGGFSYVFLFFLLNRKDLALVLKKI